jgi:hypothetical protein
MCAPNAAPGIALRHRSAFQYGAVWPRRMHLPYSDSCLAAMLGPHTVLLLHRRATSMAWLGMGALASVLYSFLGGYSLHILCSTQQHGRPLHFAHAGVLFRKGVQREHRSMEHCENDEAASRMRPLPSPKCAACVPWRGMRRCVACMTSAAADRGCGHACFCRASLILPCFTHFSRVYLAYSVVRKLSESGWFGAKAFYEATAFNANIGSWNTAAMTSMSYVCTVFCHRLCVRRACLGVGCGAARPVCRSAAADRAMHAFCFPHSSALHSFLENTSHTS